MPSKSYEIGVYYFPNYHVDPRNEAAHGTGWTEWELVKRAEPRFPGHQQPKVPFWGHENEADPAVMAKKIDAAADHGVNHFIFDWYWYNDGPFLERGLEEGFLKAANNHRLKFAIMWANHDWLDIMPAKRTGKPTLQYPGAVSRETFDRVTDHVISRYFSHPSHWNIDGCPYFSIYELTPLIRGLGGLEATRAALADFRAKTKTAGFPDLHLNAVIAGVPILPNEVAIKNPNDLVNSLGFDSVTSYVWIHNVALREFPATPYETAAADAIKDWPRLANELDLPYYPNVTMGWDSSPRTVQSDVFVENGYPWMPTLDNNTPQQFESALRAVKDFLDKSGGENPHGIFNINAWNEWTEGSYLEPDTINKFGYLEAIRSVFGTKA